MRRRAAAHPAALAAATLALCTALLSACSGGTNVTAQGGAPTRPESAASVTSRLGAVPIPSTPAVEPTPVASRPDPQLLAMGAPVVVRLPGAAATITTYGPVELTPYLGGATLPTHTVGIITVTATPTAGSVTLRAADFLSRGETGTLVSLAPVGPASVTATPGKPAHLRIKGTFSSGAAQVTWRYRGKVLVIWDFNIELD